MKIILSAILLLLAMNAYAFELVLLGKDSQASIDQIKQTAIVNAVENLLSSCTTKVRVDAIPKPPYIGVRLIKERGVSVEVHLVVNSLDSYYVEIYTQERDVMYLHAKYMTNAYPLIAMLKVISLEG